MSATVSLPPDAVAYLDQVRQALADLPVEDRDELLADLEVSLVDGAADAVGSPADRLGPPDQFARELRAAAGLEPPAETAAAAGRPGLADLWDHPRVVAARELAGDLTPAWWILRGWVAASALAVFGGLNWSEGLPFVPVRDFAQFGLALVLAGIAGSVWLGRRHRAHPPTGRRWPALNLVLAALVIPLLVQAAEARPTMYVSDPYFEAPPANGLTFNGEPVRNVYPYDRNGKLLLDVLLYDDLGRPLDVGSLDRAEDPDRRHLVTRDGEMLRNAFPIRYQEPGSARVADPRAAPDIDVPEIRTPPLRRP